MISLEALEHEVRELAKTHPDATYDWAEYIDGDPGCYYSKGKAGEGEGCIIGQALAKLGVDVVTIDKEHPKGYGVDDLLPDLLGDGPYNFQCFQWFGCVQDAQDDGKCWSKAIEWADECISTK